jgi:hypothetical protein
MCVSTDACASYAGMFTGNAESAPCTARIEAQVVTMRRRELRNMLMPSMRKGAFGFDRY